MLILGPTLIVIEFLIDASIGLLSGTIATRVPGNPDFQALVWIARVPRSSVR